MTAGEKKEQEVKPVVEVKNEPEEDDQHGDDDESDSEKKEPKLNEKGEYDGLRIKLKGLQLNRYVRDTNSLHKIVLDLFVNHLKCDVPKVKAPKITDRWLVLEMASNEDKKKVLTTITNNYRWPPYRLTVRNCEKGAFTFRQPDVDDKGETIVLTEDNVMDVLLKYHKMPYFQQLQTKSKEAKTCITEVLERLKTSEPHAANQILKRDNLFEDIVPSPVIDGYSNDNLFSFVKDKTNNTVQVGIMVHSAGKSVLAPIEKCRQVPRQMMDVILDFTSKIESLGLSVFDPETKEGTIGAVGIQMNGSGEMLMSIYTAQSQESSFVRADVMRKKPNKGQKGDAAKKEEAKKEEAKKEEAKKEEAKKVADKDEPKEGAAKEDEAKVETSDAEAEKKAEENPAEVKVEAEDKKEEETNETGDGKKEDAKNENDAVEGERFMFKKLKEAMNTFYEDVGKSMGVKSIYKGTILYSDNGDLVEKLISFTFLAGLRSLKEVVNGVEFVLTPSRLLWPNTRSFGILASVTERLAKICPSTVVVLACNDQRWLPTYFAKKCQEVLAFSTWTTQTCQELKKTSHQKGIHNISYFNCNSRIPPPILKRMDRMVLVVWDHGDEATLKKCFATGFRFEAIVQVVSYADKRMPNRLLKPLNSAMRFSYAPVRVVPVDVKPLSHALGLVVLLEPSKNVSAKSIHSMKRQLNYRGGSSRGKRGTIRGGGGIRPRTFGQQGGAVVFSPPRYIQPPTLPSEQDLAVNLLAQQNEATRTLFETLVQNYVAPQPPPNPNAFPEELWDRNDVYFDPPFELERSPGRHFSEPNMGSRKMPDNRGHPRGRPSGGSRHPGRGNENKSYDRGGMEPPRSARRRSRSPPRQRSFNKESDSWERRGPGPDAWERREPSPPHRGKPYPSRRSPSPPYQRERDSGPPFGRERSDGDNYRRSNIAPGGPSSHMRDDRHAHLPISERSDSYRRVGPPPRSVSPPRNESFRRGGGPLPRPVSPPRNESFRRGGPPPRPVSPPRNESFRRSGPGPRPVSPPRNEPFRRSGPPPPRPVSPPRNEPFRRSGPPPPRPVSPPRNEPFRRSGPPPHRPASPSPRNEPFRRSDPPRPVSPPRRRDAPSHPSEMGPLNSMRFQDNQRGSPARKNDYFGSSPRNLGGGFKRPISPEPTPSFEVPFKRQREALLSTPQGFGRSAGSLTKDTANSSFASNYQSKLRMEGPGGGGRFPPTNSEGFMGSSQQRSPPRRSSMPDAQSSFNSSGPVWSKPAFSDNPFGGDQGRDAIYSPGENEIEDWSSGPSPSDARRNVWSNDKSRSTFSPPSRSSSQWPNESGSNGNPQRGGGGGGQWVQALRDPRRSFEPDVRRQSSGNFEPDFGSRPGSNDRRQGPIPKDFSHPRPTSTFPSAREPETSTSWYDEVELQNSQQSIFARLGPNPRGNESMPPAWNTNY